MFSFGQGCAPHIKLCSQIGSLWVTSIPNVPGKLGRPMASKKIPICIFYCLVTQRVYFQTQGLRASSMFGNGDVRDKMLQEIVKDGLLKHTV